MRGVIQVVVAGLSLTVAAAAGCYSGNDDAAPGAGPGSPIDGDRPDAAGGSSGTQGGGATGLPCDVDALLTAKCRSCHGAPLTAPVSLMTYEDLAAPSKSDPSKSNAVVAVERMRSESAPMPPSGNATAAEIETLEDWIAAGLPRGTCGRDDDGDGDGDGGSSSGSSGSSGSTPPPNPALVCTSKQTYSGGQGPNMNPGRACITCHLREEGKPIVRIGGTVYPTLFEPDMCLGVNGGASVVVTDANNRVFTMPVGPTGNFSLRSEALTMPFTAKVVRADGAERSMISPQSNGDCNSCHAEAPKNGAPGRIRMPD